MIDLTKSIESHVAGMPRVASEDLWTVGRNGIYFVSPGGSTVSYFDLATNETHQVFRSPQGFGHGLAVSRDEHFILYARPGTERADIMIMENYE